MTLQFGKIVKYKLKQTSAEALHKYVRELTSILTKDPTKSPTQSKHTHTKKLCELRNRVYRAFNISYYTKLREPYKVLQRKYKRSILGAKREKGGLRTSVG